MLFEISIATTALLCLLFAWQDYLQPQSICIQCISYGQHMAGSCFLKSNMTVFPLIRGLNAFTFKVINDIILLFVFYVACLFHSSVSFLLPSLFNFFNCIILIPLLILQIDFLKINLFKAVFLCIFKYQSLVQVNPDLISMTYNNLTSVYLFPPLSPLCYYYHIYYNFIFYKSKNIIS